jgi:CBS domain-containing protein
MAGEPKSYAAGGLITQLSAELRQHAPFAQMAREHVQAFVAAASEAYYAPDEVIVAPDHGPVTQLRLIRRGAVRGERAGGDDGSAFHFEAGDLFPVAALLGGRSVTSTYRAQDDVFCLEVGAAVVQDLAGKSGVFADYLNRRVRQLLELSQRALQAAQANQALAEHSFDAPLAALPRKAVIGCPPQTPLMEALRLMHQRRVGSILAVEDGRPCGILTRHDVLERVALSRPGPDTPLAAVMTKPALTIDVGASINEAVLTMTRHGIRHLPLTEGGQVVSMVTERDLFSLQRLSVRHVSGTIRAAFDLPALVAAAHEIRRLARQLVAQGLAARTLTQLLSHLNDLLTRQLVQQVAEQHRVDLRRACWLAFGSEGRSEQTIATDQDNGLVLADDIEDKAAWLGFAREVNQGLDACGYPLCKGNVMASNPECCLTVNEWVGRFDRWIDGGSPEDLLAASIYFDFRPLVGAAELAEPMREFVTRRTAQMPRFVKQMADNALRNRAPLNWRSALDPTRDDGHDWIDLKLNGTTLFVDAARLYALAHGVPATGTRERLTAAAGELKLPEQEAAAWVGAFEVLQMFRLRLQIEGEVGKAAAGNPNRIDIGELNELDLRVLKAALRVARRLQQRVELDYAR